MNRIIIYTIMLLVCTPCFSQQIDPPPAFTREHYLLKSKQQKKAARVLLVAGGTLLVTGIIIISSELGHILDPADEKDNSKTGALLSGLGGTSMIASIPLFIASKKNRQKAAQITF